MKPVFNSKIINAFRSKAIQLLSRIILGGIFIYASIDKIAFPNEFAQIVKNYTILPDSFVKIFAFCLPPIELIFGIFLIVGIFVRVSALSLSFLLIIFIIAIFYKSINGTLENCGCFSLTESSTNTSVLILLFRDVFLILLGNIIFFRGRNE